MTKEERSRRQSLFVIIIVDVHYPPRILHTRTWYVRHHEQVYTVPLRLQLKPANTTVPSSQHNAAVRFRTTQRRGGHQRLSSEPCVLPQPTVDSPLTPPPAAVHKDRAGYHCVGRVFGRAGAVQVIKQTPSAAWVYTTQKQPCCVVDQKPGVPSHDSADSTVIS